MPRVSKAMNFIYSIDAWEELVCAESESGHGVYRIPSCEEKGPLVSNVVNPHRKKNRT